MLASIPLVRRFSLRWPLAWLAGWHLALPVAVVGALVVLGAFSPVMGDLTLRARREFSGLWMFASAFVPLLILARTHLLTRDTAFTSSQRLRLFMASTAMVAMFGLQLVAAVIGESMLHTRTAHLYPMELIDVVTPLSFAMSAGMTLAALGILYHQTGRARALLNASVFMTVAGLMSSMALAGVLWNRPPEGLIALAGLLLVLPLLAVIGPQRYRLAGLGLGAADLAVLSAVPFFVGSAICAVFFVEEIGIGGLRNDAEWAIASTVMAITLFAGFAIMVVRQRAGRLAWGTE